MKHKLATQIGVALTGLFLAGAPVLVAQDGGMSPAFGEQIIYKVVHGTQTGGNPLDALSDREL